MTLILFRIYYFYYCHYHSIICIIFISNYYAYYHFRSILLQLYVTGYIMAIMAIISLLFELCHSLTIITIMAFKVYYMHYFVFTRLSPLLQLRRWYNSYNWYNSNNIYSIAPVHKSDIWLQILGLTARMHSYTSEAAITAKILRNPGGQCTSFLAGTPKKQAFSTVFDSPQLHERDATAPHIWPNVYLADALPREPIRIVRGQPEQTAAWPKHGDASCSHGTFLPAGSRAAIPWDLLQVTGPSQCPRVDEPHPASIACARPAVAGSARKGVAHAVRNSSSITDRYHRKFAQDTLNGNDVQDRFLVVKLVYHPRSNRFQPSYNKSMSNNCNNCNNSYNTTLYELVT
jgi:hypothetical protein